MRPVFEPRGAAVATTRSPRWLAWPLALLALAVSGCDAGGHGVATAQAVPVGKPVGLTITSYNYTNRYIDQFFVNGAGGGNVFVSNETSGGGGGTCCVMYTPGTPPPKTVRVRWQASGCIYYYFSSSGKERLSRAHHFFKEADAAVDPHVPAHPVNFEVHFYPDGHVEAASPRASASRG